MADEYWGEADFELLDVKHLGNYKKPTIAGVKMYGEIRGEWHSHVVTLVCDAKTNDDLAEEIAGNCLYPWVGGIIASQDTVEEVLP